MTEHYVTWSELGWSCTCGAGRRKRMPVVRARVAAQAHKRAHEEATS